MTYPMLCLGPDGHARVDRKEVSLADVLGEPIPPSVAESQETRVSATLRKGRESEFLSACSGLE
jgi:hypothetical protein